MFRYLKTQTSRIIFYSTLGRLIEFDDNTLIPCEYRDEGISWDNYENHIVSLQMTIYTLIFVE